jgi:hypothetical protein
MMAVRSLPIRALVVASVLAACSTPAEDDATCGVPLFGQAGKHPVGVAAADLDGVPVAVWYPAAARGTSSFTYDLRDWLPPSEASKIPDEAAPTRTMDATLDLEIAAGNFPVVLFSHGLGGYRFQSSFLMTHLASWGFVVIAPEHPERNLTAALTEFAGDRAPEQLTGALALVKSDPRFAGHLDETRIAVMGRFEAPLCYGAGKVAHAERWARERGDQIDDAYFYTDSYSDLPMLARVARPRVVCPDPRLRRAARRRGWPILEWGPAAKGHTPGDRT